MSSTHSIPFEYLVLFVRDNFSTLSTFPNVILVVPITLWFTYRFLRWLVTPRPLQGIPHYGPPAPFGDIGRLITHIRETGLRSTWFNAVAKDLGPISQIMVGWSKAVILSDIQEMEDILLRRTKEFDRSSDMIDRFVGFIPHGQISLRTGHEFKTHRRFLTPAMTQKYLSLMTPGISANARQLYRFWDKKRAYLDYAPFDPSLDFELSIEDTLGDITFGDTFKSVVSQIEHAEAISKDFKAKGKRPKAEDLIGPTSELHQANTLLLKYAGNTINSLIPRTYHRWISKRSDWRKAKKLVWRFLEDKIKTARAEAETRDIANATCVVDLIAGLERQESLKDVVLPMAEFTDELFTYMIGGSETTAVTLRWVVKYLAANPHVQRKLHDELVRAGIPSALEDDAPFTTFADLYSDKVPYLDAVSSEMMRVSKVANITTRETLVDTQILGHPIPKGTTIFFTITATGFSETEKDRARLEALNPVRSKTSSRKFGWWGDDAQSFVPERWIDAEGKFNSKAGPSMPFSTGPRGCYGQKLAWLELKVYLALLSTTFFLDELPEHLDGWGVKEGLTMCPQQSYVVLKRWSEIAF